jgi:outer membrane protein assembly factor BamD (BamD/ComL family)
MVVSSQRRVVRLLLPFVCVLGCAGGCKSGPFHLFQHKEEELPAPPGEIMVMRGDQLEPEKSPIDEKTAARLAGGQELYRLAHYEEAEKVFHRIADNKKNGQQVAEEARFYEAECLRRQEKYPKACDTYNKLLTDFPTGTHRDPSIQHIWEIADYWLEDTRKEMLAQKEKLEHPQKFKVPTLTLCHFEKSKPFLDEEGRAVEALEHVYVNDIKNSRGLGAQALFMLGTIKAFREEFSEADYYFSQYVEHYSNEGKDAAKALEMAIFCKHMGTGGSDYDGRKVAEARDLIYKARASFPELTAQKSAFLDRQMVGINLQQAEKDFKIAEFYRRTGHPGAAYFYYAIVRRRYPGTPFFVKATERMHELRKKEEKELRKRGIPVTLPDEDAGANPPVPNGAPELAPPPRRLGPPPAQDPASEQAPAPRPLNPQLETAPMPNQVK